MVRLKYEIVFYNVYGPGQIKNSNMSAVIGIFETQYNKINHLQLLNQELKKEILHT